MRRAIILAMAALLAAGCSGRERVVAEPLDMVAAKLSMMPEEANAMGVAGLALGSDVHLEPQGETLVWHFTKDGADYCRFTARLIAAGPDKTRVVTRAEQASESADAIVAAGGARPDYQYACNIARIAAEESVAATLEGRAANTDAIYDKIKVQAASDPMAVGRMAKTTMEDAARHMESMDPCTANPASQVCQDFEAARDHVMEAERMANMPRPTGQPFPPPGE